MAKPVRGSSDRDFNFDKLVSVFIVPVDANDPSDFALTSRSVAGIRLFRLPPRILYEIIYHNYHNRG